MWILLSMKSKPPLCLTSALIAATSMEMTVMSYIPVTPVPMEVKMALAFMVNNYVKQHIIEAPVKKRYDKTAVASLFVIAILKPVYTISEISLLMKEAIDASDKEASYNYFCGLTERAVNHASSDGSLRAQRRILS